MISNWMTHLLVAFLVPLLSARTACVKVVHHLPLVVAFGYTSSLGESLIQREIHMAAPRLFGSPPYNPSSEHTESMSTTTRTLGEKRTH